MAPSQPPSRDKLLMNTVEDWCFHKNLFLEQHALWLNFLYSELNSTNKLKVFEDILKSSVNANSFDLRLQMLLPVPFRYPLQDLACLIFLPWILENACIYFEFESTEFKGTSLNLKQFPNSYLSNLH